MALTDENGMVMPVTPMYGGGFGGGYGGFGGGDSTSTIYVTVGKEEGAKPEFTEVVR